MVTIPFPTSSSPGRRSQEGGGRLINAYAEPLSEGGWQRRRAPGLKAWGTSSNATFRGAMLGGSLVFVAKSGKIEKFATSGGAATDLTGTFAGTDRVFFARNNAATPDNVIVSPSGGVAIFNTTNILSYPDADVGSPNAVCFLDSYFFFTYGDAKCRASGVNSTSIDLLHFTTAEMKSDTLLRPVPYGRDLLLCGTASIEVYANTANPTGFPFSRVGVISRGLLSAHAIAGFEDGFGDERIIFAADDNGVYHLQGYKPVKISEPWIDDLIEKLSDKTTLEASVYVTNGHPMWELSCAAWTITYDLVTKKWHERRRYLGTRARGTGSVWVLNKWITGDVTSGNMLEIDAQTRKEVTNPQIWSVESAPVAKFPNRIQVARADFNFVTGVGIATGVDPDETDPTVAVSWSNDGGVNWSNPLLRKLGRQADAEQRVTVTRTGLSGPQGRRWRLEVSDAVDVALMDGSDQSAELRVG